MSLTKHEYYDIKFLLKDDSILACISKNCFHWILIIKKIGFLQIINKSNQIDSLKHAQDNLKTTGKRYFKSK